MAFEDELDLIKAIRSGYDPKNVNTAAQNLTVTAQENLKESSVMGGLAGLGQADEALLSSFYKLTDKEKVDILQDAVLAHQKFNWYNGQKVNTIKDLELFDLKAWAIKVASLGALLFVLLAGLIIVFTPSGANTPVSNRIDNLKDVLSLIFN